VEMLVKQNPILSDKDFDRIRTTVYQYCGTNLSPLKKTMVQSRLLKKIQKYKMDSYSQYLDFVFIHDKDKLELIDFIDLITTNKTDFFREAHHFSFLEKEVLPKFNQNKKTNSDVFKIWSAGCSSGHEPYTSAMVLQNFKEKNSGFNYHIFASDISTKVLEEAKIAIYNDDVVEIVPMEYKRKYLLKSKDKNKHKVRIIPELRKKVEFRRLNFMDNDYQISTKFDVIFCRNVLIYFDYKTQEQILQKLCKKLKHGAFMFLGHSESILNMDLPLSTINPSVFIKDKD
jgi:chemotaxis protein methyltransferase CheR